MTARLILLICLTYFATAQGCNQLSEPEFNGCQYNLLTVTSIPDELVLEKCGSEYKKTDWKKQPKLKFDDAKKDKNYTVVMVDPDAINIEEGEYYLHWIASNISGTDLKNGDYLHNHVEKDSRSIRDYRPPGPPPGTGVHRYIFLAFEQSEPEQFVSAPSQRKKFDIVSWLKSQPKKLCGPVAGNQFRTQF